jgi:DNA-directed RNA polymerase specialized sigma24 family protein
LVAPSTPVEAGSSATSSALEQELVCLYQEHAAALSRYAVSFARYFIERRYGRIMANPRTWLYHVLRNYLLDWYRRVNNREVIAENLDHMPGGQQNRERILQRSETARGFVSMYVSAETPNSFTSRRRQIRYPSPC